MGTVTICQHPDQRVGVVETLPYRDDIGAVLLEDRDLLLSEPLMEVVDVATLIGRRVHPELETARVGRHVGSRLDDVRPSWRPPAWRSLGDAGDMEELVVQVVGVDNKSDRKRVVQGKRVDLGGRRIVK